MAWVGVWAVQWRLHGDSSITDGRYARRARWRCRAMDDVPVQRSFRGRARHVHGEREVDEARRRAEAEPQNGRLWMRLARMEQSVGRKREALQNGLREDPENGFLWHALGMVEWREAADISASEQAFRTGIERAKSGSVGALYQSLAILVSMTRKEEGEAVDLFEKGLTVDPGHGPLYVALAETLKRSGKWKEALEVLQRGVRVREAATHAPLWRAFACMEQRSGRFASALEKWAEAVRIDPSEMQSSIHLAELMEQVGRGVEVAAEVLRKALAASSDLQGTKDWAEAIVMLAGYEERMGDVRVARAVLHEAKTKFSPHPPTEIVKALASLEAREGNMQKARELFSLAAAQDESQTIKILHNWAICEAKFGSVEQSKVLLEKASERDPSDSAIWRAIGELESRELNFDRARAAYRKATKLKPHDVRLWHAWGKCEVLAGNHEEGEKHFRHCVSLASSFSLNSPARASRGASRTACDALCEIASLASRDGRLDDARNCLREAVTIDSSQPWAWRFLADIEDQLIGEGRFREVFQEAIRQGPHSIACKISHWWGIEERKQGNADEARKLFHDATRIEPNYMSAWLSWGLLEKELGNLERACEIFEEGASFAIKHSLKSPFLFQTWGRLEEQRRNYQRARQVFAEGLKLSASSAPLMQTWGLLEERQANYDQARELFQRGAAAEPTFGSIFQSWALLEARLRRYGESTRVFELGIQNDPQNAALYTSWALVEGRNKGNVSLARDLFKKAVDVDPKFNGAWNAWAAMEVELRNYNIASDLLHKAMECSPSHDAVALHSFGVLQGKMGSLGSSREAFQKALAADPSHTISYQAWALVEERLNPDGLTEARRLFKEGTAHALSDSCEIWQSWALFEERQGRIGEARQIFETGLELAPNNQSLLQSYAIFLSKCKDHEKARRLFEAGVNVCPRDAAPCYTAWAQSEYQGGNPSEARRLFQEALRVNPSHAPAWKAWSSMEESLGMSSRAHSLRMASFGLASGDIEINLETS